MSEPKANIRQVGFLWAAILQSLPPCRLDGVLLPPAASAEPDGILPLWFHVAEKTWHAITGTSPTLQLQEDDQAALGVTVLQVPEMRLSALLPCLMHSAIGAQQSGNVIDLDPLAAAFLAERGRYLAPASSNLVPRK